MAAEKNILCEEVVVEMGGGSFRVGDVSLAEAIDTYANSNVERGYYLESIVPSRWEGCDGYQVVTGVMITSVFSPEVSVAAGSPGLSASAFSGSFPFGE